MQITHEEAHRLIQFKIDNSLTALNDKLLTNHLRDCAACQHYYISLRETESVLRTTLTKQWKVHPLPLQLDVLYERASLTPVTDILLSTRKALIGVAVLMFAFITWQTLNNGSSYTQNIPGTLPMIPTPATQYTATNPLQNDCKNIRYVVQPGDSLESIAQHFSTSKESIMAANGISMEGIQLAKELIIRPCESTPTSTTHPPAFTITPNLERISITPG